MNATQIKELKDYLRSLEYSTSDVTFLIDSDDTIDLLGWNFIPGLKDYLINEISEILDFVDRKHMNIWFAIEYDEAYDIASIFYNGRFWTNIEPTE